MTVFLLAVFSFHFFSCGAKENDTFRFEFEYKVVFNQSGEMEAWIPIPQNGPFQTVDILSIDTPLSYRMETDSIYHNLFLHVPPINFAGTDSIMLLFRIHRLEASAYQNNSEDEIPDLFLQPYRKVPLNPDDYSLMDSLSESSDRSPRNIYGIILNHMQYDKSGKGWGLGDAVYACNIGKGNCTDYHSLFNALVRLQNIPARFNIGFPIPNGSSGPVTGYHCWTEFSPDGKNWIPVDISNADNNPDQENYYFGRLDNRRVKFTVGRDIPLPGGGSNDMVNFSIYPYVKINDIVSKGVVTKFSYAVLD